MAQSRDFSNVSRLQVIVAKLLQELPYEKRDGDKVASAWLNRLAYDAEKVQSVACGPTCYARVRTTSG